MARKRMINPMLWEDPSFNLLSRNARLLFVGMISHADDEGYLRGDAGSLKRLIFGFDNLGSNEVDEWRKEIDEKMKNVNFYEESDEVFVHLCKWHYHQRQQKERIQPSQYPMCSKCVASDKQMRTQVKLSKVKLSKDRYITPSQEMQNFVSAVKTGGKELEKWVAGVNGLSEEVVERELRKFCAYWTERTKSGKHQLWETKNTFEVKRRLATWFGNYRKFNK